jgi:hypothetical protein
MSLLLLLSGNKRVATVPAPTAPVSAKWAIAAHPDYCASDASHLVPCTVGSTIRWWKELVSGTWFEQATAGDRLTLRSTGVTGKYYAESDGVSDQHTFDIPAWSGTNGICGVRNFTTSGASNVPEPLALHPGSSTGYMRFGGQTYAYNFRTARADTIGAYPTDTSWHTYTNLSGAAYETYVDGSMTGTVAASFAAPVATVIIGQNIATFFGGGIAGAVIYENATSRVAGEAWLASLAG